MLNIFDWMRGHSRSGRTATDIYGSIVAQARDPTFYRSFGVSDVAEKRYEMIVLHIVLVLQRLRASGEDGTQMARAVIEAFVRDLDGSMREMAVGDTKVPAKVKKAAGGLYDRDLLYRQAFDDAEGTTLGELLSDLILDGGKESDSAALLRYAMNARDSLRDWHLVDGPAALRFPVPADFLERG